MILVVDYSPLPDCMILAVDYSRLPDCMILAVDCSRLLNCMILVSALSLTNAPQLTRLNLSSEKGYPQIAQVRRLCEVLRVEIGNSA